MTRISSYDGAERASGSSEHGWVEWFGRAGYAAKGAVYAVVGVLALMFVFDTGDGKVSGSRGALKFLDQMAWGDVMLYVIAAGLFCYTAWRWAQGFLNVEHLDDEPKNYARRAGLVISGALYAFVAVQAIRMASSLGQGGQSSGSDQRAAEAMSMPGGTLLVGAVGVGFVVTGLYQIYRAWKVSFEEHWKADLSGDSRRWATRISRFGIAARAVIFLLMGGYITWAAVTENPAATRGLGETLGMFSDDPVLLGVSAVGLICYSVYAGVNASFRRIPSEK